MGLFKVVFRKVLLPFTLLLSAGSVFSADNGVEELKAALATHMPNVSINAVSESMIPGLYEVIVGSQVVYMDKNARYMLNGDLIDLSTRKNLTEGAKSGIRLASMNKLNEKDMLVYTPRQVDHTITVVTDIDCPYCRRLHSEMDQYMAGNVKVRYIFMPLKGPADFDKTVSVWCSKDKNKALDSAKRGENLESLSCDNPIKQHLAIAREIGIRGTPAIILESGELLPGYVEASELIKEISKQQAALAN